MTDSRYVKVRDSSGSKTLAFLKWSTSDPDNLFLYLFPLWDGRALEMPLPPHCGGKILTVLQLGGSVPGDDSTGLQENR